MDATKMGCPSCEGRGWHEVPRTLHESGGVATCSWCDGSGLREDYDKNPYVNSLARTKLDLKRPLSNFGRK